MEQLKTIIIVIFERLNTANGMRVIHTNVFEEEDGFSSIASFLDDVTINIIGMTKASVRKRSN